LLPSKQEDRDIEERIAFATNKKLHYCYREFSRHYTSRIFSCEENRKILENEFLNKGSMLLSDDSFNKGIYPLGFSSYPSLGFGALCAFEFNISNTCPIVLWWGNLQEGHNSLDKWYPLLPRRINTE
jgi:hypothetical protein